MKTAAVTGATGFIGRHLVAQLLADGVQVRVLTRNPGAAASLLPAAEIHTGDLARNQPVPPAFCDGVDVLYHCAGEVRNPAAMHGLHVEGTARLLEVAIGRIGHWVQLSSVGAYGHVRHGRVDESSPCAPVGPYEITKTLADALVEDAARAGRLAASILRPSTVFGQDMPNRSLAEWVDAIWRGRFFFIGPRGAVLNYVHVSAVVEALLLCGRAQAQGLATYVASEAMPIEDFVQVIAQAVGRPVPRLRLSVPAARAIAALGALRPGAFPLTRARIDALTSRAEYVSARLRRELGWQPALPLPAALHDFAAQNCRAKAAK